MVSSKDKNNDSLAGFEEIDFDSDLEELFDDDLGASEIPVDPRLTKKNKDQSDISLHDLSDEHNKEKAAHSPGVLIYNNKRYAVGLTWLTLDEDAEQGLAKERAKRLKADFYCVRNTVVMQHGFGYIEKGHKMGMNAAGALAADALIGEWHGIFTAENGWWYLAVHADTVEPDGDIFFESEEEAYNHFIEMNQSYSWPRAYAPEDWNLPKTNGEIALNKLFDDMPSSILKPSSMNAIFGGKRNKEVAIVIAGLCLAVIIFAVIAKNTIPNLIPKPKEAPGLQITAPNELKVPPREYVKKDESLEASETTITLPMPSKVIDACLEAFADLAQSFPGWNLETMRCRNGMAEARWMRGTTGSLESLQPYLGIFPFGVSQSYSGDNMFLASKVIGNLKEFNVNMTLIERETAIIGLNSRFGKISNINVKDVIPERKQAAATRTAKNDRANKLNRLLKNEKEAEAPKLTIGEMPYLDVDMKFNTPPNLITNYFDIPGLTFDVIEWNIKQQRWAYEARVILKLDRNNMRQAQPTNNRR